MEIRRSTPITLYGSPLNRIFRPMIFASRRSGLRHTRSVRIATSAAPFLSSPSANNLPSAA